MEAVEQLTLFTVNTGVFLVVVAGFFFPMKNTLLLWLLLMLIQFLSWLVMYVLGQDKSQQHVGKPSLNMNPHCSEFLDGEVVNEIAVPGTVYIAAKAADHHHVLPSPSIC